MIRYNNNDGYLLYLANYLKLNTMKRFSFKPLPKPKVHKDHTNRHHVVPSSRGGRSTNDNIAILDIDKHQHYHHVFDNKDPVEIIEYLVSHFWHTQDGENGDRFVFEWLDKYYEKN